MRDQQDVVLPVSVQPEERLAQYEAALKLIRAIVKFDGNNDAYRLGQIDAIAFMGIAFSPTEGRIKDWLRQAAALEAPNSVGQGNVQAAAMPSDTGGMELVIPA